MSIRVSFYLLNPKAKGATQLYVSVSKKPKQRERFATGEEFYSKHCNVRNKKGGKDLLKRNTASFLQYSTTMLAIQERLEKIDEKLLAKDKNYSLLDLRDEYEQQVGIKKRVADNTFVQSLDNYVTAHESKWSPAYVEKFTNLKTHLIAYQTDRKKALTLATFNDDTALDLIDYFIKQGLDNVTSNMYIKNARRFVKYAIKKKWAHENAADGLTFLKTVKNFKISFKEYEVEKWIGLNLSFSPKLDKARDLFTLEILTGQRFSDVDKVLDRDNYDGKFIRIYQQKTGELVAIPRHTKLEAHLDYLLKKYPDGFPTLSSQKLNEYIKEVGELCGFDRVHKWVKLIGSERVEMSNYRYNLITSHTGRRSFCTLAKKAGIPDPLIMKVTGHTKHDQFLEYIRVDDEDVEAAFSEKF